jgi:predicted patatin/cPLA2 family phospholipase
VHEVLRVIEERARSGSRPGHRDDGLRIALSIEGGGMRGTVSAGMALALYERGLLPAFDAVYGSSAGAISGAWLLSSNPEGLRGWADPDYARSLIRWRAPLRRRPNRRPVVDVETLVEVLYQTEFPMDFASILVSPVEYHPLATDAATGESTDLRPLITDEAELRLALRASASLPFLAGPPIELHERRFYDAGVAESIPFRTPLAQGATHILVLRSRRPLDLTDGAETAETAEAPETAESVVGADDPANAGQAVGLDGTPAAGPQAEAKHQAIARLHAVARSRARSILRVDAHADAQADAEAQVVADDEAAAEVELIADHEAEAHAEAEAEVAADGEAAAEAQVVAEAEVVADDEAASPPAARPTRSVRLLTRTTLRNESPELRTAMLTRAARNVADAAEIAERQAAGRAFAVFPPAWTPSVSRLTTEGALLTAALVAGREAVNVLFDEDDQGEEGGEG